MKLKTLAAILALAMSSTFANAGEETITLRFADQFPLKHAASRHAGQAFEALIEERSNGRVQIEYFPAQQLAKAKGMLDAVRNRVTDIGMVGVVYVPEQMPLSSIVGLPGLFTDLKGGLAAFDALARNEIADEYARMGVRPLFMASTPPYQLQFSKLDAFNDISDIEGMKVRVSGGTGELVIGALGGVGVRVSGPDTYVALDRGTVDATMLSIPSVLAYKLEEITTSATRNVSLGTVAFSVMINSDVYNELPEDVRTLIDEVARDVSTIWSENWVKEVEESYATAEAAGVKILDVSPEVLAQMDERLATIQQQWVERMNARGLPGAETLEAFKTHLANTQ